MRANEGREQLKSGRRFFAVKFEFESQSFDRLYVSFTALPLKLIPGMHHTSQHLIMRTLAFVLLLALFCFFSVTVSAHVHTEPYQIGDEIIIECRRNLTQFPQAFTDKLPIHHSSSGDDTKPPEHSPPGTLSPIDEQNQWGVAITCAETGRPLSVTYGMDGFLVCGWMISNSDVYRFAAAVVQQEAAFQCRVPMDRARTFFLPLTIPLWGVVEPEHLHINIHFSFVFHVDAGRLIAASIYPVRDRFQMVRAGSIFNVHGPVRWNQQHSFNALQGTATESNNSGSDEGVGFITVFLWCILSASATFVALTLLYLLRLKPMLAKRYLKGD